jgi:integrase
MAWIEVEGWRAGRAWRSKAGKLSFYIRRGGKDYATGASTLPGALAALERLEKTGEAQIPESAAPVVLDVGLAKEFLAASKAKGNSRAWRVNQRQHLDWWQTQLGGRDLRAGRRGAVTIEHIEKALDGAPSRRQRVAVLKSLFAWLRRMHRIATAEDPTWGQITVPPTRTAQDTIDKTIDPADLETVIGYLDAKWMERGKDDAERDKRGRRWADILRLLAGCGIHVTEARRFAEAGLIEDLPGGREPAAGEVAVLAIPLHKTGAPFKVAVSAATKEAAERVRAAGSFSIAVFYAELRKAAKECGATVHPGAFRHTIARYAVEQGATIEQVAAFHRHKDKRTTWKYAQLGVAPKIPTPR